MTETPSASLNEPSPPSNKAIILETPNPTNELAREVTEVLRSLRLKKIGSVQTAGDGHRLQSLPESRDSPSFGLVDSGATVAARTGLPGELEEACPVTVQLAVGEVAMRANKYGTLLSPDSIQPIVPAGVSIRHPSRGLLPVQLRNKCPELPCQLVLELIEEHEHLLEQKYWSRLQAKSAVAATLQAPVIPAEDPIAWIQLKIAQEGLSLSVQAQWLHMLFPELPRHVLERVVCPVGFNESSPI